MPQIECDVAVIGAGTAGLAAERRARARGAKTLLIDPAFRGTTCAAVGCMPSKLLIAAANAAHTARNADLFGIRATLEVDGPAVMRRVREYRDSFVAGVQDTIHDLPDGVAIKARASFAEPGLLALDTGGTVKAETIIIATGASSMLPGPFESVKDRVWSNEDVFEIDDLPKTLAVVGAGPLGLELAQAFARLGVEVSVFDQGNSLAGLDEDDSRCLAEILQSEMDIHTGADVSPVLSDGGITFEWAGNKQEFEKVLMAAGRPPALDGLCLERSGLELDDHGTPLFDPRTLQCGDAPVFVIGDANHDRAVLHEASDEGTIAGENAATYPNVRKASRKVPLVVAFVHPGVAMVGQLPKDEEYVTAFADYSDQGRAKVDGNAHGFARLHADKSGKLIAATLCMPDAEHVAQYLALAISAGMTAGDILDQPIYHPTLEEGLRSALEQLCTKCDAPTPWQRRAGPQLGS
ncbi:dihydrolipoyl dehydrogenase [Falsirhodobacter sp. alg1]|uniref:dihydrolipoyl dehydrogenase n=1 Tax=Falsirhodobacter sp. alg1 TaxID=1472418 RepID=UPI00178CB099|nr:dihydrolipoyl dehydrogenase [Falsirhodobacter sp. alg1]